MAHPIGQLLGNRAFMRLWIGGALTNAMRWLEILITGVFAFSLSGSALTVALVLMMRALPMLFAGAFAGALAESVNRRHLLMAGLTAMASGSCAIAILAALDILAVWHLAMSSLLAGLVWAGDLAVRRRMISDIAGEGMVVNAIALDTVTNTAMRMIGPIIGGAALEIVGLSTAYIIAASCYLAALALALGVPHEQETRAFSAARLARDVVEAVASLPPRGALVTVFAVTVVMNVFGFSYSAILPAIGAQVFMVSATLVGVLAAAEPMGGLIGGIVLASGRLRPRPLPAFLAGSLLFLVALALSAFSPVYAFAWAVFALAGFGASFFASMQSTLVLIESPVAMRSRAMGLLSTCIGTGPFGVLLYGWLGDVLGPMQAILVLSLTGLACVLALVAWNRLSPPSL